MDFLSLSDIVNDNKLNIEINELDSKDIAIIGISAKLPMADNASTYWKNILNKVESIKEFPVGRRKTTDKYLRLKGLEAGKLMYYDAAFLDEVDEFDPKLFHLSPKEAKLMDPRQRIFLQQAWNAIEDAGYSIDELKGKRVGVYSGFSNLGGATYLDMLTDIDPSLSEVSLSGNLQAIIPSRISYMLDFKGPSMVVDTACSSSLISVHLACQALRNKECESAIVGSVRLHLLPLIEEYKIGFESKDGRTKAFDDSATGTGLGEGAVCVILKPLQKAKADGDHIYAVIKGTAINQDGNSIGITAPNADAQADVIERAWKDAGVSAEDISYIEAHGTGTILGDPIEIDGISKAFSKYTSKKQFCAIGSVKNNIGHLYEASGLASVIKCIFALNEKILPPSINYKLPNKSIDFYNSPVYVNVKPREWEGEEKKRICGISSFGFSGTNCHIILEEGDTQKEVFNEVLKDSYLLVLSGKSKEILKELANRYLKDFNNIKTQNPMDVCFTASVGRNHYKHRLGIIFSNYDQLREVLKKIVEIPFEKINDNNIYYNVIERKNNINNSNSDEQESNILDTENLNKVDLNTECEEKKLQIVAIAYVNGKEIQWEDLYSSSKRKRAKLPSWVFEQGHYWIDIPDVLKEKETENKQYLKPEETEAVLLQGRSDGAYTATERKLGAIIKKVMEYDKIDIYDNFYEFGGDSILVTKFYSKIAEYFQINLTIADIFSYPSIALLSKYIDELVLNEHGKKQAIFNITNSNKEVESEIAIIGIAGRFPLAENIDEYWDSICSQKNCICEIPENRKTDLKNYLRQIGLDEKIVQYVKAGYLGEVDKFDYEYFGISLKEATLMDPIQRMFLEVIYELIEEAGYGGKRLVGSNTGVFVGYTEDYIFNFRRFVYDSDPSLTQVALSGNLSSIISGRISYALDLKGLSMVIDTACSSSLVALNTAIKSLRNGECESAIVGGAKMKLVPLYEPEGNVGVESAHYMIRAFDDDADGLVEGESVCAVMLKPLKQAIADGDNIHAVIKGSAVNQDGTGMGIMAPRAETQSKVIIDAWKDAGINPSSITYIEAHGTGTKLGDLIEYEALKKAFKLYTNNKQFCAISSVKSNVGHLYQASGIASLIKAVLSLENKKMVPTLNFDRPNRLIDFEESALYVNEMLRDWDTEELPRRCGVSSFGLSGTNCHVVLEEYDEKVNNLPSEGFNVVTISGMNEEVLQNLIIKYQKFISKTKNINMEHLSYTTNVGRGHYNERLAFIVRDKDDFKTKLSQISLSNWKENTIENVFYGKVSEKVTIPNNINEFLRNSNNEIIKKIANLKSDELLDKVILQEICALYVTGVDIDWKNLYKESKRSVISLPTYPFMRKRCWFQPKKRKTGNLEVDDVEIINDYEILELQEKDNKAKKISDISKVKQKDYKNDVESTIIKAFEDVIKVDRVTVEDNFFELGGNSLKATMLASKVYELLDVLIPLSDILSYPTVGDLAEHIKDLIEGISQNDMQKIQLQPEQEFYDLSLKQFDLWLSAQVYQESSVLNITWASTLYNFDISILYKALEAVVNRHPIMKVQIEVQDGVPKQTSKNWRGLKNVYRYIDISEEDNANEMIMKIVQTEVSKQFDLENEPLIRITVAKIDETKHALVFVISHIISDRWSLDVIMNDLKEYYKAFSLDIEPKVEAISVKYSDFSAWYRNKVERCREEFKKYWDNVLHGPLPVLNIRTDFKRPLIKGQNGRSLNFKLNSLVMNKLKNVADLNQGTMFMNVLTGVYTLLHMYSGQNDIIVGINTSGREHPELRNQVGYYVNVLPLRIDVNINETYTQLFKRVRNVTLGALEHQDYPFLSMLDNEAIIRDSSRSPIFDVLVQYINDSNNTDCIVDNARIEEIEYDSLESKYDLIFNFIERENEIMLQLEYSDSLFKEETINRMIRRLNKILEEFSKNQHLSIDKLKIEDVVDNISLIKRKRG